MKLPIIFAIDDDLAVLKSLKRDLQEKYAEEYRILATASVEEAREVFPQLLKKDENIALIIADQRMPELDGVSFLKESQGFFPDCKKVLLTAYSDTDAAIRAINEVQLDYYFTKPWDPPEEKLYPVLDDLLEEWQAAHAPSFEGIRLVGHRYSLASHQIKDFLAGHLVPYQWLDVHQDAEGRRLQEVHNCSDTDLPLVIFPDGESLCNPAVTAVAEKIGMQQKASQDMYDVVIIGAGPSGLAAAVYAGSEGLKALLIERHTPGGQAGTSSRIENYLGFPNGLSGSELTRRALSQAKRFGVEFLSPQEVKNITLSGNYKRLTLSDDTCVNARSLIITTGVSYRMLEKPGLDKFYGKGVYYGAAMTEANACSNQRIFIVGGGNSAGQGAVYLAQFAKEVIILIRSAELSGSMSSYLVDQIRQTDNIQVWTHTEITEAKGEDSLNALCLFHNQEERSWTEENVGAVFIFIGAKPHTDWLPLNILKDKKGFIETGRSLTFYEDYNKFWKIRREPYLLETCSPGIFAAGDVRSGAMNRIASAVGEGAMAVKFVHQYLAEN